MEHCIDLYTQGKSIRAYQYFGSTVGNEGTMFRVYAPHACSVRVVGDFNAWDCNEHVMEKEENGVFSLFIKNIGEGSLYKYAIIDSNESIVYKSDPYAFYSEVRPNSASIVYDVEGYDFLDKQWLASRTLCYDEPLLIYEMHVGSYFTDKVCYKDGVQTFFNYKDKVEGLVRYLKKMRYSHVEFMPLVEHPDDGSWGYLGTGFFSATSRFGSPKDLMYLIDVLHQNKIGVIMDVAVCHFVKDEHGLGFFDGSRLYQKEVLSEWGSYYFDYSKGSVCSFMMSSLMFWIDYFHIDGIRFDAISHLIYNQGNSEQGQYKEGIAFLRYMNQTLKKHYPTVMTIAEDSSSYVGVTKEVRYGGLGFDYKWDLGWMNDTLWYLSKDPIHRKGLHECITFSMMYFYNERYILPLSHDEVVHGKKTIVDKMFGCYDQKFALARCLYVYMMTHPGKKLNFMSNDLGELKEFDEKVSLDFNVLKFPMHDAFHCFFKDMQGLVSCYEALYKGSFNWIVCDDVNQSVFIFEREYENECFIVALNFTPNQHDCYDFNVTKQGTYIEVINSDCFSYNGNGFINEGMLCSVDNTLSLKLAPLSGCVIQYKEDLDV